MSTNIMIEGHEFTTATLNRFMKTNVVSNLVRHALRVGNMTVDQIADVKGIGPKTQEAIRNYMDNLGVTTDNGPCDDEVTTTTEDPGMDDNLGGALSAMGTLNSLDDETYEKVAAWIRKNFKRYTTVSNGRRAQFQFKSIVTETEKREYVLRRMARSAKAMGWMYSFGKDLNGLNSITIWRVKTQEQAATA